jgi:thymidylate synthase
MGMKYEFSSVNQALPVLLSDLLEVGEETGSRNGRVKELLNTQVVLKHPGRREILVPNRGANVYAQIAETMWVLAGRNDVEWLSAYLPRAKDYSDDGETWRAGYGTRIRDRDGFDQLSWVVDLLRKDPLTRQAVIQIWDLSDTSEDVLKDRACNTQLQFQSRLGRLHLTVTVRSNDVMWGWSGINAFEWSTFQEIVASLLGLQMGDLVFNIANLHLYEIHWAKARKIGPSSADTLLHARVRFNPDRQFTELFEVDRLIDRWFIWEGLCRTGEVSLDLLADFEEPLFRSWAAAIAYYWTRGPEWSAEVAGTALAAAMALTPASVLPEPVLRPQSAPVGAKATAPQSERLRAFYEYTRELHAAKHRAYGDSWKKRGEKMSILANIARKVDRLGVTDDMETAADTAIDLWVYLAKYLCWLNGEEASPKNVDLVLLKSLSSRITHSLESVADNLNTYMDTIDAFDPNFGRKQEFILYMMTHVAPLAFDLWDQENEYRGADVD